MQLKIENLPTMACCNMSAYMLRLLPHNLCQPAYLLLLSLLLLLRWPLQACIAKVSSMPGKLP
jgi:hypothetical protein